MNWKLLECSNLDVVDLSQPRTTKVQSHRECMIAIGQGEEDIENWRALYLRPQSKQLSNPKFAVFCDNWDAATAYAPYLNEQASSVRDQIASTCAYKTTSDWNPAQPYARLCVPTKTGVKKGIDPSSYILRINPFGADTDSTSNTFYKSWISNGQIKNAMCGAAMH